MPCSAWTPASLCAPAFSLSAKTLPGMLKSTQCTKPTPPVGASRSHIVTANDFASTGAPDQLRSGLRLLPVQPPALNTALSGTVSPSRKTELDSVIRAVCVSMRGLYPRAKRSPARCEQRTNRARLDRPHQQETPREGARIEPRARL